MNPANRSEIDMAERLDADTKEDETVSFGKNMNEVAEILVSQGYPLDRAKKAVSLYKGDLALAISWLEDRVAPSSGALPESTGEVYLSNLLSASSDTGKFLHSS